jgi:tetratricopeptide (TPR) repeat protein
VRQLLSSALAFLLIPTTISGADLQVRPPDPQDRPGDCQFAADCPASSPEPLVRDTQVWRDAAALHRDKVGFVDAIRQFTEAQSGTCGDEGAALERSVGAMKAALQAWDAAIRTYEGRAKVRADADAHAALATVYLERRRDQEALRELRAADANEHERADINVLLALASDLNDRPADALRALKAAAGAGPANAATQYRLGQHLIEADRPEEATAALRAFVRIRSRAGAATAPVFDRLDLFRQDAATAPIFPSYRYQDGYASLDSGRYADAVASFESAIATDPLTTTASSSSSAIVRAGAQLCGGNPRAAIGLLDGSAEPAASERERILGTAYFVVGDHNRAIELLRTAVRGNPADDRAREVLALVLRQADRPSEAEQVLRDALAALPRSGRAAYMLGELLEARSLPSEAVTAFEAAVQHGPIVGRDPLLKRIGGLDAQRADLDAAVDAYRRRVATNPNSGEAHRQLAEIYFLQGQDDFALAEYVLASWIDPDDARAAAGVGQVHLRGQRHAEAVTALQRSTALDPRMKDARYALALALTRSGNADAGRREMERFAELQAESDAAGQQEFRLEALRRDAFAALASGAQADAVARFREVVAARNDSRSLAELGAALMRARQPSDAIPALESAVAMQPSASAFQNLADAYAALGNAEASRRYMAMHDAALATERLQEVRDLTVHDGAP